MKPYVFHPEAEVEFLSALSRYASISEALGLRFHDAIRGLLDEVCAAPDRYPYARKPVRWHFGRSFPYALLYAGSGDVVIVLAVAHFRRRPGYWRQRMRG